MAHRTPNLAWHKDPNILKRMGEVEDLHLMGIRNVDIARQLKVDHKTITNDLNRINILWKERLGDQSEERRARSVAVYRRVQRSAWQEFASVKDNSLNKSAYLNTVKSSEDSIAKVLDLAIDKVDVTSGGKPIVFTILIDGMRHQDI